MRRRPSQELLDTDAGSPSEVSDSLQDLRWFNRWFGGLSTSRQIVQIAAAEGEELSVLEVAAGDGFVAQELQRMLKESKTKLQVTLLDRSLAHLPTNGNSRKVGADALALPFKDASFDVVFCSLFAHHLSPEEVGAFAREALRVSRIGLLVHDLVRHPLHLAFAYAGVPLYRSRITRNDAPASVWQAYTAQEMRSMLERAGAASVEIHRQYFFRMGAIAWKNEAGHR